MMNEDWDLTPNGAPKIFARTEAAGFVLALHEMDEQTLAPPATVTGDERGHRWPSRSGKGVEQLCGTGS